MFCNQGQETQFSWFSEYMTGLGLDLSIYISPHAKHQKPFSRQEN